MTKKSSKKKIMAADLIAPEADYLYVAPSQIPNAGSGLYTVVDLFKDEIVSYFTGELLTDRQIKTRVDKNEDQYFIARLDGNIMDSMKTKCFAKYANDNKGSANSLFKNNTKIVADDNGEICLQATRKIKAGEEVYTSYGKEYWKKHGVS
jgi:uncharacterized protein